MREHAPDVLVLEPQLPWGGGEGVLAIMGEIPELADRSRHGPYLVPRSSSLGSRIAVSGKRLSDSNRWRPIGWREGSAPYSLIQNCVSPWPNKTAAWNVRSPGEPAAASRDLRVETVDGRVIVRGRSDSHHVKQLALAAVLEAFEASQSQSERVELDIEVAPIDGWQARRCALSEASETTDENYSNELALTNEFALTKEN